MSTFNINMKKCFHIIKMENRPIYYRPVGNYFEGDDEAPIKLLSYIPKCNYYKNDDDDPIIVDVETIQFYQ